MSVHRIRLVGPWEWRPVHSSSAARGPERQPCRLPFPALESPASSATVPQSAAAVQPVWLFRRFHRPTGIDDSVIVLLAVEVVNGCVQLQLNGVDMPFHSPNMVEPPKASAVLESDWVRFDVTHSLKEFNELQILVAPDEALTPSARVVSVCLEMHD